MFCSSFLEEDNLVKKKNQFEVIPIDTSYINKVDLFEEKDNDLEVWLKL